MENTQSPRTFVAQVVNVNGMSLACYVPGVTMTAVLDTFPRGTMEGYYEPSKGYVDCDVGFFCPETSETFYVYARWGQVRIGTHNPESPTVKDLTAYLQDAIRN